MADAERADYSIVIPAYNEEALLPRALSSVRRAMAACPEWTGEMVVADNASTDRTAAIAAEHGARVVYEPHRQIARARNAGARAARGRWLIFLDADSAVSPALLRRTLKALESGLFCGGGARVIMDEPLPLVGTLVLGYLNASLRIQRWAAGGYLFCLRDVFEATGGFDERFYASEEYWFSKAIKRWGRRHGMRFTVLGEPLVTSARKVRWLGFRGLLRMTFRMGLNPRALFSREGCASWYERPPPSRRT